VQQRRDFTDDASGGERGATQCPLSDGCVSVQKVRNFLHNKYIPGRDNVASHWLPDDGHMFDPLSSLSTLLSDMRSYLLTRPLDSITLVRPPLSLSPLPLCELSDFALPSATLTHHLAMTDANTRTCCKLPPPPRRYEIGTPGV
jgi:hypothetical protein